VNNNQEVKFNKNQKELTIEFKAFKKLEKKDKIEFRDILFEYDKADLLPQSYVELDKILQIIKDNPYAKFELSAHTDSRGKDSYNLKLSQKRAESCVNYLVSKGVSTSAIIAKGYGEKQLKNNCGNNAKCSEEEHAVNRRVEIKVLDIKE
jgi:outer membrane protein OmpA-like peptidoglycan-associated protein